MNRSLTIVFSVILVALAAACGSSTDGPPDSVTLLPPDADVLSVGIVVPGESQVLKGWLYGDENDTLVILSHMRPNDQRAWEPFAMELADNGYAALTFDFRGHGISTVPRRLTVLALSYERR